MLYSVMNRRTRAYDYFESGEQEPWHSPPPPRTSGTSPLGAVPEEAAWVLPASAKYMGSGQNAKGRVAVRSRASGSALPFGLGAVEPAFAVAGAAAAMVAGLALLVKGGNQR